MSQITISKAQAAAIGKLADEMTGGVKGDALTLTAWHEQLQGYEASRDAIIDAMVANEEGEIPGEWRLYPGGRVETRQKNGSFR